MPSQEQETPNSAPTTPQSDEKRIQLESVQRISSLPVISTGINLTTGIYSKVRESNSVCRFLFRSAEHTVNKATQIAQPVTNILEKPIKLADSTICKTVDVAGRTIPKVIETPQKICSKAISVVPVQPAVDSVKTVGSYGKQTVKHLYNKVQKVQNKNPAAGLQIPTTQDGNECETDPEKLGQNGELALANGHVKDAVKIFDQ